MSKLSPDLMAPHQLETKELIKAKRYLAIWLGMRQGKTVSTLSALQELYDEFEVHKILVVAPLKVSINSWPEDLGGWEHISLPYTLIRGTPAERIAQLAEPTPVHIINRELLAWLVTHIGKGNWPYDTVILDESRSFKNHKKKNKNPKTGVKTYTRFGAMALVRPEVHRLVELTGTPAPKNYADLWAQMFLLDGGRRLGKTITAFRDTYMHPGREHYLWDFKDNAEEEIREAIKDIAFSIQGKPLPVPVVSDIWVELPPKARTLYDEMRKESIIEVDGVEIVAQSAAARGGKLHQIAAGFVYDTEIDETAQTKVRTAYRIHNEKRDALDELLEFIETPVMLIYNFEAERDYLLQKYPDAKLLDDKPMTVKLWNQGLISKLVLHGASGGHGLTLWRGGHDIIWVSPTYDLEHYQQVNERLTSDLKAEQVTIHRILTRGTIDEPIVNEVLTGKAERQKNLMNYLLANHPKTGGMA